MRALAPISATVLLAMACAESTGSDGSSGGAPIDTPATADVCVDGCTRDGKRTCVNGTPAEVCSEPLACSRGVCAPPCAVASNGLSSAGCSFYTAVPDSTSSRGACFAVALANPSTVPAKVAIEFDGAGVDVGRVLRAPRGHGRGTTYEPLPSPEIAPGEIAIAFISGGTGASGCPAEIGGAGIPLDLAVHGPSVGKAFHVRSSVPVTAHAIYPFGGASSGIGTATTLFPVHSWDKKAIAVELNLPFGAGPLLQLVSAETDAAISIVPRSDLVGGGSVLASSPADRKVTFRPGAGGLVQFSQQGQFSLTGSYVEGSGPFAIFAGSACTHSGVAACDPLFQQIPPMAHLGSEYVGVRPRDRFPERPEATPWHLVGLFDGTTLTYEPSPPEGAPTELRAGQIAQFRSSQPFVVRSQDKNHRFYAAALMESCRVYGTDDDCRGDPEAVTLVPTSRYGERASFFSDPSYPETSVVVVRASVNGEFRDVELDCVPKIEVWEPVGSKFQYARVDLSRGNFGAQGACDNGVHALRSAGPITASLWGWGSAATRIAGGPNTDSASYGYAIVAEPRIDAASLGGSSPQ